MDLTMLNEYYQHTNIHTYYIQLGHKEIKINNRLLCNKTKCPNKILGHRAHRGDECGSDQHLLKATLFFPYKEITSASKESDVII